MDVATFVIAVAALLLAVWALMTVYLNRESWGSCVHNHAMRLGDLERRHNYHTGQIARCEVGRDLHSGEQVALARDVKYLDERIANLESYANLLSQAPAVQCDVPPWSVPVLRTPSEPKPEVRGVEETKP